MIVTADAGRYGPAIPVELTKGAGARYYVRSPHVTYDDLGVRDILGGARPVTLGWVARDNEGAGWSAWVDDFAGNRTTDPNSCHGTRVAVNERTRAGAVEALVWHIACRGRTWLVSTVR
ncbi:MAG: hypothetical protein ABIV94_00095 [Acidimicrobiales bacterium]